MSIYEAIGMAWVIFTSALATVGIVYFCIRGMMIYAKEAKKGRKRSMEIAGVRVD